MTTVRVSFPVPVSPDEVWDVFRDVGAVHTRLAPGFVVDTVVDGDVRHVTFANGVEVTERIVTVDDTGRRLVYAIEGGAASHHNASFEVVATPDGGSTVVWTTDVLPDAVAPRFQQMMAAGADVMTAALTAVKPSSRDPRTRVASAPSA